MSRVIAIQMPTVRRGGKIEQAFDFTPAEKYGRVEILIPNGNHILTPDLLIDSIGSGLEGFNAEEDYIIPVGDYSVIFTVALVLGQQFNSIRILRWVPEAKAYQPVTLIIRN